MNMNKRIDGAKVKARREAIGFTQHVLASKLDIAGQNVSGLENREGGTDCRISFVLRLAAALECTVDDITSEYRAVA